MRAWRVEDNDEVVMANKIATNSPENIVDNMLRGFLRRRFDSGFCTSTADAIANTLIGKRVMDYYHFDITDPGNISIAKQYLRGILADHRNI